MSAMEEEEVTKRHEEENKAIVLYIVEEHYCKFRVISTSQFIVPIPFISTYFHPVLNNYYSHI